MKKDEGYIATDYKEDVGFLGFSGLLSIEKRRTRVAIRLTRSDGLVEVAINTHIREFLRSDQEIFWWEDTTSDGALEREIKERMDSRVFKTGD